MIPVPEHLDSRSELISIADAAKIARRSENTMRNWCGRYGIAVTLFGRWAVNRIALRLLLNQDREGFHAFLAGDRSHPDVVKAYRQEGLSVPRSAKAKAEAA